IAAVPMTAAVAMGIVVVAWELVAGHSLSAPILLALQIARGGFVYLGLLFVAARDQMLDTLGDLRHLRPARPSAT
ncbi:MAG: hypothetical protein ACR2RL_19050, partial [Gammaproteobacteria bacterium]